MKIEEIASSRGYIVTEDGEMLNPKGESIGVIGVIGYKYTMIRVNGKKTIFMTHRLQAYQKYRGLMYDNGVEVRHRDGDKLNNGWGNILIGTHSDNMMDIPKQIRIKKAKHATSFVRKYNKDIVKIFHKKNNSYKKTMDKFNISSKGTLHYILNN